MNSPNSKGSTVWWWFIALVLIYLFAPMIAGLSRNGDRRGPKIYWEVHHQLLFSFSHEFVYNEKPRPLPWERGWFYGLRGEPDLWLETFTKLDKFEEAVGRPALMSLRESVWQERSNSAPFVLDKSEWPSSFVSNHVFQVRVEKGGILVLMERAPKYEAGIFLLGTGIGRSAVENDPAYSRGNLYEYNVYRYYRRVRK